MIKRMLSAMFEIHSRTLSPDALRLWLSVLDGLTVDQISIGIKRFTAEFTGFPTPAALRKCCGAETVDDRAHIAWGAVIKAVKSYGVYGYLDFTDAIVNAAIWQMGGWAILCHGDEGSMAFRKKDFIAAYERVYRTGSGDPRPVRGIPMDIQPMVTVTVPLLPAATAPQTKVIEERRLPDVVPMLHQIGVMPE
jgi:hypothetical protein